MEAGQDWIEEWQEGELALNADSVAWMRTRPDSVKAIMREFPPSCLVRAKPGKKLLIPAPGVIGVVTSYAEVGEEIEISVADHPDSDKWARCKPEWLEVVGYYKGLTLDVTKALLETGDLN